MTFEQQYKDLLENVIKNGVYTKGRNSGTLALCNQSLVTDSLPLITSKKIWFKKAVAEFVWFIEGRTDLAFLHQYGVKWWDFWSNNNGHINKSYGYQLRNYNGHFDQLEYVLIQLREPFSSRRARISLWNPGDLQDQALPCCYTDFDFVSTGDSVDMVMTFRSSDLFLGLPYDVILGYLLHKYVCERANKIQGRVHYNLLNAHLYLPHILDVEQYLELELYAPPNLTIFDWHTVESYNLKNYKCGPIIKTELIL